MSIQSEINRIKGNVESSFSAVEAMGGTVPEAQSSDGLPAAIQSIPQGATYIAGDGIDIAETAEGPKIGVTTPVQGIVTQAEFDALPEEQQNKGFYVISDSGGGSGGGGGESAGEVYSTEEIRIGTWIDGKPLYRKVFYYYFNNISGNFYRSINISDLDVEIPVRANGFLAEREGYEYSYQIPSYDNSNFISARIYKKIQIQVSSNLESSYFSVFFLNFEYTKTTDTATISTAEIVAAALDGLPEEDLAALAEAADAENVGPEVAL